MADKPKIIPPIIMEWMIFIVNFSVILSYKIIDGGFVGMLIFLFILDSLITVAFDVVNFYLYCTSLILAFFYAVLFPILMSPSLSNNNASTSVNVLIIIFNLLVPVPLISYICLMNKYYKLSIVEEKKELSNSDINQLEPLNQNQ